MAEARTRNRAQVLVACASEWSSPARLPPVLRQAGCEVTVLTAPRHPLGVTRYSDERVDAPATLDGYVDALEALLRRRRFAQVFVTDDPLLSALCERRLEPWLAGVLPIAGPHAWGRALASKADFCTLGAAAGLPIPASRVCRSFDEASAAGQALGYPLMLKQSHGFAGLGVRLVEKEGELAAAWQALAMPGEVLVAQRFVSGAIGNTVFYCHRGAPTAWMSAFKVRTWPGPFGPSSARRFAALPTVAPLLARLGELTGYHGFGALDWVLDEAGELHLIELNARPVPTIHMAPLAGVDFAAAIRESLDGTPVMRPPPPPSDAVHPMFPEDVLRAASEKTVSFGAVRDVPWSDPALVLYHLRNFYRLARLQAAQLGSSGGDQMQ